MKKLISFVLLLLVLASLPGSAFAEETADAARPATEIGFDLEGITAQAAYVVNRETGRVVFQKNATQRMYPASTTKIMSAALALELCPDAANTMVTVPAGVWNEFAGINISSAGLMGGEEISMLELVHCMLLQSANEAASTVAAYFGREEFIRSMNAKARALGCTDTNFVNPHGLYDADHYTTAADLWRITEWALSVPGFWEIACKSRYELSPTNKHDARWLTTTVKLQDKTSGYYTKYIRGIKTGTIDESGRCLVTAAEQEGVSYVAVLLGCPMEYSTLVWEQGNSVFTDARRIFDWCYDELEMRAVTQSGTPVAELPLRWASQRDYLMLYAGEELHTLVRRDAEADPVIRFEPELPEQVSAPVEVGEVFGKARVYSDDIYIGEVSLIAGEAVELSYFAVVMDYLRGILTSPIAMILYALLFLLVVAYIYYMLVWIPAEAKSGAKNGQNRRRRRNRGERL